MKEKILVAVVCVIGLVLVFYGMTRENNAVFIAGIVVIIGSYLFIRKRLKESIGLKKEREGNQNKE